MSASIDPEKLAQIQAKMAQMPPKSLGRLMDDMSSRNPVALAQLVTTMKPQLLAQAAKYMKPEVVAELREQIAKQFYKKEEEPAPEQTPPPKARTTPKTFSTPKEFTGILDESGRPITPEERERRRRKELKSEMGFEDDDDDDDDDDEDDVGGANNNNNNNNGIANGNGNYGHGNHGDGEGGDAMESSFYDPTDGGLGTPPTVRSHTSGGGPSGATRDEIDELRRAVRDAIALKRKSDETSRQAVARARRAQDQLSTAQRLSKAQVQILRNTHESGVAAQRQLVEDLHESLQAFEDLVSAREVDGDDVPATEVRAAVDQVRKVVDSHASRVDASERSFRAGAEGKNLDAVEEVVAENVVLRRQLDEYEAEEAGLGEKARLRSEVARLQSELESAKAGAVTLDRFREVTAENAFLTETVESLEAKHARLEAEVEIRVREAESRAAETDRVRALKEVENRIGKVRGELADAVRERDELRARIAVMETEKEQALTAQSSTPAGAAGEDVRREIVRVDRELKQFVAAFDLLEEAVLAQQQQIGPVLQEAVAPLLQVLGSQNKVESALLGKYRREVAERKRLFNLVQELRGNIRVFVRCRPLLQDEVDAGKVPAFSFGEDELDDESLQITDQRGTVKPFKFDRVYGHSATQERIFEDTKPLVTSVMDGYNVCIFAYGQTGSGKTYTMQGPDTDPGVNLRTLIELFTITEERSDDWRYTIKVAMVEIYNETIRDLLDPDSLKKKYEIRQGPEGNYVPGLVEVTVTCIEDVTRLMQLGNENRSMASTAMNEYSSRSHSLLLITVEGNNAVTKARTKSKLTLVDLAGSERVSKSEVTGQRLVEAQNINRSLSALGDVMAGLHQHNSHIPYRNSKLTHLLADSLGGDSKTCVFVHCAPDRDNVNESICSLNFAVRVSKVELGQATKQVVGSKGKKK